MAAVTPRHVGQTGSDVLLLAAGARVLLAELVEAEAVEGVRVGVEGVVEANGVGGDADLGVCGDEEAVGEAEVFANKAFICNYTEWSTYRLGGGWRCTY